MKNVFIISNGLPNESDYLNGQLVMDFVKNLKDSEVQGISINLIVLDIRSFRRFRKAGFSSIVYKGIPTYIYSVPTLGGFHSDIQLSKLYQFSLSQCLGALKKRGITIDLIHGHFLHIGYAVAMLSDKFLYKSVLTEHLDFVLDNNHTSKIKKISDFTYNKVNQLVTVSPVLREAVRNIYGIDSLVISNFIDNEIRISTKKSELKENRRFVFVSVAHNENRKRLDFLIKTFLNTFSENEAQLIIVGKDTEELSSFIPEYLTQNQIQLLGSRPKEFIYSLFDESNAFVLPSLRETFGIVYAEALVAGLPVISTKCGGPEHFINKENGILIEVDNELQLNGALRYMYLNFKKFNIENIKNNAKARFSKSQIAREYYNLYFTLLGLQ